MLLLCDFESPSFMRQLKDVTVNQAQPLSAATFDQVQPTINAALQVGSDPACPEEGGGDGGGRLQL